MLKKCNIFYCGGLQLLIPSPPSSPPSAANRGVLLPHPFPSQPCRLYATAQNKFNDDLSWPATTPFTPYDIFKQKPNAPYSKARFYDLVKIYHPDRPCNGHPLCKDISPEVRLHRYRLIVAAHEILSDPAKREAYDRFGAGWNYRTGAVHANTPPSWMRSNPVYTNATWEDSERFRNRHNGKQQTVVDHRTFAKLIILLALFGGAIQLSMIGRYNTGYEQRIRDVNEKSARFLTRRRGETVDQPSSSEARVKQFLIRRDPSGFGLKEDEQEVYREMLQSGSVPVAKTHDTMNGAEATDARKLGTDKIHDIHN